MQPPDTFPGLYKYTKIRPRPELGRNGILVYLEPRERVCWMRMSFCLLMGPNSVHLNPLLN